MYSMAESYMIPKFFAKLHPKYKTPINSLILIGAVTMIAPLAGRKMLVWISDAGNFGCCMAYCMVAISFVILRKKAPDMARPYKVPCYKFVGAMAILMSALMVAMYCIPGSGATLVAQEWVAVGSWCLLGVVFYVVCKRKYKENFGMLVEIISELQRSESALREENDQLRAKLADRSLKMEKAGSLAEASLALNGVFEAAQAAADQYLTAIQAAAEDARVHSLRAQEELGEIQGQRQDILEKAQREAEDILSDAQAQAGKLTEAAQAQHRETAEAARQEAEGILSDAQAQAQKLTQDAEAHIDRKWESFQENTQKLIAMHAELQSLLRRE